MSEETNSFLNDVISANGNKSNVEKTFCEERDFLKALATLCHWTDIE